MTDHPSKIEGKVHHYWGDHYGVWCPACDFEHTFRTPIWSFNGDFDKPTFTPSMLVTSSIRCHSHVINGMIIFGGDCQHDMKGQTVELPDFPK